MTEEQFQKELSVVLQQLRQQPVPEESLARVRAGVRQRTAGGAPGGGSRGGPGLLRRMAAVPLAKVALPLAAAAGLAVFWVRGWPHAARGLEPAPATQTAKVVLPDAVGRRPAAEGRASLPAQPAAARGRGQLVGLSQPPRAKAAVRRSQDEEQVSGLSLFAKLAAAPEEMTIRIETEDPNVVVLLVPSHRVESSPQTKELE